MAPSPPPSCLQPFAPRGRAQFSASWYVGRPKRGDWAELGRDERPPCGMDCQMPMSARKERVGRRKGATIGVFSASTGPLLTFLLRFLVPRRVSLAPALCLLRSRRSSTSNRCSLSCCCASAPPRMCTRTGRRCWTGTRYGKERTVDPGAILLTQLLLADGHVVAGVEVCAHWRAPVAVGGLRMCAHGPGDAVLVAERRCLHVLSDRCNSRRFAAVDRDRGTACSSVSVDASSPTIAPLLAQP